VFGSASFRFAPPHTYASKTNTGSGTKSGGWSMPGAVDKMTDKEVATLAKEIVDIYDSVIEACREGK